MDMFKMRVSGCCGPGGISRIGTKVAAKVEVRGRDA
jgi:hypothetical protein